MANIKIFTTNNAVNAATVITADSENALFPVKNIKDQRSTKVSRSQTGTLTNNYVFDLIVATKLDAVMLVPDNIRGFAALTGTVTLKGNIIDGAWGTAPFSITFDVDADAQKFKVAFKTFPEETFRFWRITVSNTQDFVELGKVLLGKAITFKENNIDFGWTFLDQDNASFRRNRYKQRFSDKRNKQKVFRGLNFRLMTPEEMEELSDGFSLVGKSEPFWFIIDEDANVSNQKERFAGYFYLLSQIPAIENDSVDSFDLSFAVEEAT